MSRYFALHFTLWKSMECLLSFKDDPGLKLLGCRLFWFGFFKLFLSNSAALVSLVTPCGWHNALQHFFTQLLFFPATSYVCCLTTFHFQFLFENFSLCPCPTSTWYTCSCLINTIAVEPAERSVGKTEFYYPKDGGQEELILLWEVTESASLGESELLLLLPAEMEVRLLPLGAVSSQLPALFFSGRTAAASLSFQDFSLGEEWLTQLFTFPFAIQSFFL